MPPPSISNTLLAQYDASTLGLSNGAAVATWPDDSASNFDLSQASAGSRPSMVTGASPTGLDGVLFINGRYVDRVSGSTVFPATKTIFWCAHNPPNNSNHTRWSVTDDDGLARGLTMQYYAGVGWLNGGSIAGGEWIGFSDDALLDTDCRWTFVLKPTGAFVRTNGTQRVSGNIANLIANSDIRLGSPSNTINPSFTMYEWLVYDGEVNSTDIATIEDYLNTKWLVDVSSGSATGAISWAGAATGAGGRAGAASGTIAWAGAATGVEPVVGEGSATGAIGWAGVATGDAPVAGEGAASGAISWGGTAAGGAPVPVVVPTVRPWVEVWSRPGAENYRMKIADLPIVDSSVTVPYSGVGKGSLTLPADYDRLNEILYVDQANPANSEWSTIKVVDDTGWLYEWMPSPRVPPGGKSATTIEFAGEGLEQMWGYARVEPWDWDGSNNFVSTFPDWIWGGRNILQNPDFEESARSPIIDELFIIPDEDADTHGDPGHVHFGPASGDYFLSDGTNNTAAIPWDQDNPSFIEAALEAAGIYDDCLVSGTGTEDDPFVIEAVEPFQEVTLTVITGFLINATADIIRRQFGSLQPSGWTRSTTVSDGSPRNFGSYASFRVVSTVAQSGIYSLRVDANTVTGQGSRYPGTQQVVSVQPGGIYQASVWVYSTSALSTFRFVIRGIDGDFIKSWPGGLDSEPIPANTWTQLTIDDVNVGTNSSVIFRVAVTNPPTFNPAVFYIDNAEFNEGMQPTTVGDMLTQFFLDATSDHYPERFVWEDNLTAQPYLQLDFDAVNDSNGEPWDRDDVAQTFRPRMTYIQVITQIVEEGGYEWRVVPYTIDGYYVLQVYNPNTLGSLRLAGIIAGSTDVARSARFFAPAATAMLAQGAEETSVRIQNAGLIDAFGRIEGSILDSNWTTIPSISSAAAMAQSENLRGAQDVVYTLSSPDQRPLSTFRPGDRISVVDPPLLEGYQRISQIQLAIAKGKPDDFEVHISDAIPFRFLGGAGVTVARGLTGQAATDNAVAALLKAYKKAEPLPKHAAPAVGGGGGMASVLVVDEGASENLKAKADYLIVNNTDGGALLRDIIATFGGNLQTIWLHGYLEITSDVTLPTGVQIQGLASDQNSWIDLDEATLTVGSGGGLRNLTIEADHSTGDAIILGNNAAAEDIRSDSVGVAGSMFVMAANSRISDLHCNGPDAGQGLIRLEGDSNQVITNVTAVGISEGPVINAIDNHYFWVSGVITTGADLDLVLDECSNVAIGNWISLGAGWTASPVVSVLNCQAITFSTCHWNAPSPDTTTKAAIYIQDSKYVTIDISNHLSDFGAGGNDRAMLILDGSSRCTISASFDGLSGGSAVSSVDFVRLVNADNNLISYGHYLPYGLFIDGNQPRHGILIDASSDLNTVVGNQMVPAARFTGNVIQDNGTNTALLFPADATYGDNFT